MSLNKAVKSILIIFVILALGLSLAQWWGGLEFGKKANEVFASLQESSSVEKDLTYKTKDLGNIPWIIRQYLEKALPNEGNKVLRLNLELNGRIKVAKDASWDDLKAKQVITNFPPQMVFAGKSQYAPMTPLCILGSYTKGQGKMDSDLWGLLNVSDKKGPVIDAYMMLRWLGESVWHPDALLPSPFLTWEEAKSVSSRVKSARVTIRQGSTSVSGVFVFSAGGGAPIMFMADRNSLPQLAIYRFYCKYSDWRKMGPYRIPYRVFQGVQEGSLTDDRLELNVQKVIYQ